MDAPIESVSNGSGADGGSAVLRPSASFPPEVIGQIKDMAATGRYEIRVKASQKKGVDGSAIVVVYVDGVDMALLRVTDEQGKPDFYQLRGRCAIRDPDRIGRAAVSKPAAVG